MQNQYQKGGSELLPKRSCFQDGKKSAAGTVLKKGHETHKKAPVKSKESALLRLEELKVQSKNEQVQKALRQKIEKREVLQDNEKLVVWFMAIEALNALPPKKGETVESWYGRSSMQPFKRMLQGVTGAEALELTGRNWVQLQIDAVKARTMMMKFKIGKGLESIKKNSLTKIIAVGVFALAAYGIYSLFAHSRERRKQRNFLLKVGTNTAIMAAGMMLLGKALGKKEWKAWLKETLGMDVDNNRFGKFLQHLGKLEISKAFMALFSVSVPGIKGAKEKLAELRKKREEAKRKREAEEKARKEKERKEKEKQDDETMSLGEAVALQNNKIRHGVLMPVVRHIAATPTAYGLISAKLGGADYIVKTLKLAGKGSIAITSATYSMLYKVLAITGKTMKNNPLASLVAVAGVVASLHEINEKIRIKKDKVKEVKEMRVPKDPKKRKEFLKLQIKSTRGLSWMRENEVPTPPDNHIDKSIDVLYGDASIDPYTNKVKEFLPSLGGAVLDIVTLGAEELIWKKNKNGLWQMFSTIKGYIALESDKELKKQLQSLNDVIQKVRDDLRNKKKLNEKHIKKIQEAAKKTNIVVYSDAGFYWWERRNSNGVRMEGFPRALFLDPSKGTLEERAEKAKSFFPGKDNAGSMGSRALEYVTDDARNTLHKVFDAGKDWDLGRGVEYALKKGGLIVINGGWVFISQSVEGVAQKYVLGPFNLIKNLVNLGDGKYSYTQLACEYADGLVPVTVLGTASALAKAMKGDLKFLGFWKIVGHSVAYPLTGAWESGKALVKIGYHWKWTEEGVTGLLKDKWFSTTSDLRAYLARRRHKSLLKIAKYRGITHEKVVAVNQQLEMLYKCKRHLHQARMSIRNSASELRSAKEVIEPMKDSIKGLVQFDSQTKYIQKNLEVIDQHIRLAEQRFEMILEEWKLKKIQTLLKKGKHSAAEAALRELGKQGESILQRGSSKSTEVANAVDARLEKIAADMERLEKYESIAAAKPKAPKTPVAPRLKPSKETLKAKKLRGMTGALHEVGYSEDMAKLIHSKMRGNTMAEAVLEAFAENKDPKAAKAAIDKLIKQSDWKVKSVCEELIRLEMQGVKGHKVTRLRIALELMGVKPDMIDDIVIMFSREKKLVAYLRGLDRVKVAGKLKKYLTPTLSAAMKANPQAMSKIMKAFLTGGPAQESNEAAKAMRKLISGKDARAEQVLEVAVRYADDSKDAKHLLNFLRKIELLEDATESLEILSKNADTVAKVIKKHGPEAVEGILKAAASKSREAKKAGKTVLSFAEEVKNLLQVASEIKNPARGIPAEAWGKQALKWSDEIVKGTEAATKLGKFDDAAKGLLLSRVAGDADKGLKTISKWRKLGTGLGFALEVVLAVMYLYEANEIEKMIERIEEYAADRRIKALQDKANTKRLFAGINFTTGIFLLIRNPNLLVTAAVVATTIYIESMYESYSIARERRARSPQEWANERSREALVTLLVSEHGLSDGDQIRKAGPLASFITPDGKGLKRQNKTVRERMFKAILLQEAGITDGKRAKEVLDGTNANDKGTRRIISLRMAYIKAIKKDLDPRSPIEANALLLRSRQYAQLKMEGERITKLHERITNFKGGKGDVDLEREFKGYVLKLNLDNEKVDKEAIPAYKDLDAKMRAALVSRFLKEKYPRINAATLALYQQLKPGNEESFKVLVETNRQQFLYAGLSKKRIESIRTKYKESADAEWFFLYHASKEEGRRYHGLIKLNPLSGSIFDSKTAAHSESVRQRQGFEVRINELYTLLSESKRSGKKLKHFEEIESCLNFCLRYYQAMYGMPYQPISSFAGLEEDRVVQWILSLSESRSRGVSFKPGKESDMKRYRAMAMSDESLKMNYQITRQRETLGMYNLAVALGYRGPLKKALLHQFFHDKRESFGFYFDGDQWVVADRGTIEWRGFDESFNDWLAIDMNIKAAFGKITPEIRKLVQKYRKGELPPWKDNILVIHFLIDYCTQKKAEMIMREDDTIFVGNEKESQKATERIGASYAAFLREQLKALDKMQGPEKKKLFQKTLSSFLASKAKSNPGEYAVLPPVLLRAAFMAGENNVGLFAYKLEGGKISAWQLAPLLNFNKPSFIEGIDNADKFKDLQFSAPLDKAIKKMNEELKRHDRVLETAEHQLNKHINTVPDANAEMKKNLRGAVIGIIEDFKALDRIVHGKNNQFNITDNHKRSFTKRMRSNILRLSRMVFELKGESDPQKFKKVFELRASVSKLKQLYLISFLHKSHRDDSFISFIWHDPDVDESDDYVKIDKDIDESLSKFQKGKWYKNEKGVKKYFERESTLLKSTMGFFKCPEYLRREYQEYYLRETTEILYMANVFSFDKKGNFRKEVPGIKRSIEGGLIVGDNEVPKLRRMLQKRRLSFQEWLVRHKGYTKENAARVAIPDIKTHRETINKEIKENEAKGVTGQAKSMFAMCIAFRTLVTSLKGSSDQRVMKQFPQLWHVYKNFDKDFLQGKLGDYKYLAIFSGRIGEMEEKFSWGKYFTQGTYKNIAHRMPRFYEIHHDLMKKGLKDLWSYMEIPETQRKNYHEQLGDREPLSMFEIRRVNFLHKTLKKSGDHPFTKLEANSFKLWYLSQGEALQRIKGEPRSFFDVERFKYRSREYDRNMWPQVKQEVDRIGNTIEMLKAHVSSTKYQAAQEAYEAAKESIASTITYFSKGEYDSKVVSTFDKIGMLRWNFSVLTEELGVKKYWTKLRKGMRYNVQKNKTTYSSDGVRKETIQVYEKTRLLFGTIGEKAGSKRALDHLKKTTEPVDLSARLQDLEIITSRRDPDYSPDTLTFDQGGQRWQIKLDGSEIMKKGKDGRFINVEEGEQKPYLFRYLNNSAHKKALSTIFDDLDTYRDTGISALSKAQLLMDIISLQQGKGRDMLLYLAQNWKDLKNAALNKIKEEVHSGKRKKFSGDLVSATEAIDHAVLEKVFGLVSESPEKLTSLLHEYQESIGGPKMKAIKQNYLFELDRMKAATQLLRKKDPAFEKAYRQRIESMKEEVRKQKDVKSCKETFVKELRKFKRDLDRGYIGDKVVMGHNRFKEFNSTIDKWLSETINESSALAFLRAPKEKPKTKLEIARFNLKRRLELIEVHIDDIGKNKALYLKWIAELKENIDTAASTKAFSKALAEGFEKFAKSHRSQMEKDWGNDFSFLYGKIRNSCKNAEAIANRPL